MTDVPVIQQRPLRLGASAVYRWDREMVRPLVLVDRFERPFQLYRREGGLVHVPLGCVRGEPDSDERDAGAPVQFGNHFVARSEEQVRVVRQSVALLRGGHNHILSAPTGFGKTFIGSAVIASMGARALVLTTKEDILGQWVRAAKQVCGLGDSDITLWRGNHAPRGTEKLVVGLVQSVMKGPGRYRESDYAGFGLVVVDEIHRMAADKFSQAMWWLPARYRLGLSATPSRADGRDIVFHAHVGPVLVQAVTETMKPRVFVVKTRWRVPLTAGGSPLRHEPGKTMHLCPSLAGDKNRNAIIAEFVVGAYAKGRRTVVFADTIQHLRVLAAACEAEGLPPGEYGYYLGTSNYEGGKVQRDLARRRATEAPVMFASYAMMGEGTDLPQLDTCVLGSPRSNVVQIVGRIRRACEGKQQPLVLDLVDEDSYVFAMYARRRWRWYRELGAELEFFD